MILKKEEMTKAIKEVKDEINSLLTKESSKEELENIGVWRLKPEGAVGKSVARPRE